MLIIFMFLATVFLSSTNQTVFFTGQALLMEEKVGKLCLDRSEAIAVGNFGTTFKGTFEGTIDVAVKRFEKEEFEVDLKAICRVNNHQNILRFYCSEENFDFV